MRDPVTSTRPAAADRGEATLDRAADGRAAGGLFGLLALVTAVQMLATFSLLVLPTLSTRAAVTFGIGAEVVGYQLSIVYAAASVVSSFAGVLVRRWGAAMTSVAALALSGAGLLGLASGRFAPTLAGSLLVGSAYGLTNPAASHLLFRFAPAARRNLVFAVKQSGVPLGGMLAALLLPSLANRIGWQLAAALSAVMHLVLGLLVLRKRRLWDDDRMPGARLGGAALAGVRTLFARPRLLRLGVTGGAFAAFQFCLTAFAINLLVTDIGWTLVTAGAFATLMQCGGAVGRVGWGLVADASGRGLAVLACIGVASATLAVVLAGANGGWPALSLGVLLVALGMTSIGWNGVYMAETAKAADPSEVGLATGGVLVLNFLGVVIGPSLFALLFGRTGSYATTFGLLAALPLVGAALLVQPLRAPGRPSA